MWGLGTKRDMPLESPITLQQTMMFSISRIHELEYLLLAWATHGRRHAPK